MVDIGWRVIKVDLSVLRRAAPNPTNSFVIGNAEGCDVLILHSNHSFHDDSMIARCVACWGRYSSYFAETMRDRVAAFTMVMSEDLEEKSWHC